MPLYEALAKGYEVPGREGLLAAGAKGLESQRPPGTFFKQKEGTHGAMGSSAQDPPGGAPVLDTR